jgi:hypothetical protein
VVPLSPRSAPWLAVVVEEVDDGTRSIADICRRVGIVADRLRLTRPSYEQVRTVVQERRSRARVGTRSEIRFGVGIQIGARLGLIRPKR